MGRWVLANDRGEGSAIAVDITVGGCDGVEGEAVLRQLKLRLRLAFRHGIDVGGRGGRHVGHLRRGRVGDRSGLDVGGVLGSGVVAQF